MIVILIAILRYQRGYSLDYSQPLGFIFETDQGIFYEIHKLVLKRLLIN